MSREKLRALGLDLPPLPTSTVGSFPKPRYLTEARARAARNAIGRHELDRLERQATEFWVRVQEDLGVDVLVDGEQYRGDMVAYFAESLGGFARAGWSAPTGTATTTSRSSSGRFAGQGR
jgi:5-methyltetrahydropteroyltriglutamate--homocysteine methyltransferase